ncbi:extracellular solute-binding protein [Paracoccus sediminis]|uniref:Carbohydrate ABC transporter substrate-binding protein, CUT1 family n=1 Tax=Paracoccus sediminis TaxID=1214787 RepID=A0A238YEF7_9RHOB|nr:extracellular solute-binding protein [Paracoccus sediminis]TBN46791.1 extracellular solute-binding protein [Paracoccus sediminis]SNR69158.1 carbohydrate ABC transporter substrate-binding protein, CUT1 family [Paracoccus sediminis]
MFFRKIALAGAFALMGSTAMAACAFQNEVPVKSLSAGFEAWKAVTDAMAECGNFSAELDQEFKTKQPEAFAARPSLYQIGGVANETIVPLVNAGTIRPLDDLVAKYGQNLQPGQLIKIDGQTMAIAMMVNTQHLMYRKDILDELGIAVPTTYDELLAAAEQIKASGKVEYPLGGTYKAGWNLAQDFVNMFMGSGQPLVNDDGTANVNNETGVTTLEMMKALSAYMDPEFLGADSTVVQQQFQQGRIAMANFWASRGSAMDDPAESQVVGKVAGAPTPSIVDGGAPATTLWWDGIVIARNISDEEADAAFRVAMEGLDSEMVAANNDDAVWLIQGYQPGAMAQAAIATASTNPPPVSYPSTTAQGLMHGAIGSQAAAFFTGDKSAEDTLAAIEAEYATAAAEAGIVN